MQFLVDEGYSRIMNTKQANAIRQTQAINELCNFGFNATTKLALALELLETVRFLLEPIPADVGQNQALEDKWDEWNCQDHLDEVIGSVCHAAEDLEGIVEHLAE
jgi:hypothetical protein